MFIKIIAVLACLLAVSCNSESNRVVKPHVIAVPPAQITSSMPVEAKAEKRRLTLLYPLFKSMVQQEIEKLPFDEPRHEIGQQDGKLRAYWEQAYFRKQRLYAFNGDVYHTMNSNIPYIPQVCPDFIIDTIDRAAGTWYSSDLQHPQRIVGKLDFRQQIKNEGFNDRSASQLLKFFAKHPDNFQMIFEGESDVEVGDVSALKSWFKSNDVQIGDIVIIRGKMKHDHGREIHYHSFFISRLDDQNQISMIIGNAGHVKEWSLEKEVARAPTRKVIAIIRLSDHFLSSLI